MKKNQNLWDAAEWMFIGKVYIWNAYIRKQKGLKSVTTVLSQKS